MTLRQPRRIFRASHRPGRAPSARQALLAGLLGVAIGAGAILLLLPADLFGFVPAPAGTLQAEPEDVAVVDGQTLSLRRTTVRLLGVTAPARGLSCHGADGGAFDCGVTAARALAGIVRGAPVTCRLHGRDTLGFVEADCSAGATDVNQAIVLAGWARALPDDDNDAAPLMAAERRARLDRRGIWSDPGRQAF